MTSQQVLYNKGLAAYLHLTEGASAQAFPDKLALAWQERAAAALRSGALQTYKQQMSFGLHVIVMMGTFYAVGHIAGTALSPRTAVVCFTSAL